MKTSSAKAKGRRLCQHLKEKLLAKAPHLENDDIIVTSSGDTGEDLKLSPLARKTFPFSFECKNQEALNVWKAFEQAQSHAKNKNTTPMLVFSRNRSDVMACLRLDDLLNILAQSHNSDHSSKAEG